MNANLLLVGVAVACARHAARGGERFGDYLRARSGLAIAEVTR